MSQNLFSEQQIEDYHTEGYLVVPRLFGEEELALVDRTVRQLTAEALASGNYADKMELEPESIGADEPVVRRLYEPFRQHENFRQLATDPRIVNRLTGLIGPDIHLQHSKLNMKPAKVGSVVEWHQDLAYFPHSNDDLVSLLIYLDDATEENGCLQVLPRHHHHFFDHRLPDGSFAGMVTEPIDDGRFGRPVPLAAPAGSVIFMHCITPHTSLPNRSEKSRRTLIFEYRAADAVPLHFGAYTTKIETTSHPIAGKPARFARFGGPHPPIPVFQEDAAGHFKSLYTLQEDAKQSTDGSS